MTDDLLSFKKFYSDEDTHFIEKCHKAAVDKLNTLYPDKRITTYDYTTIAVDSDSVYCKDGVETYELGMINDEIPAMKRSSDDYIISFRI